MSNLDGALTFKIEWENEGWGVETWKVVERNPNPANYVISKASPLGGALSNGEEIYTSPEGQKRLRIIEVKDELGNTIQVSDLRKKGFAPRINIPVINPVISTNDPVYTQAYNSVSDRITWLFRDALNDTFRNKVSIPLPELDNDDIRLSLRWHGINEFISRDQIINKFDKKEKYEIAKMLSARAAEKAVIHFLEHMLTGEIKDISVSQLNNLPSQTEWRQYNILADGIPYDVKNSRRTYHNPSNYVEHCIPRYKETRGTEVTIMGTLSHYLKVEELLDYEAIPLNRQTSVRILGSANGTHINNLTNHFEMDTFKVDFHRPMHKEIFLPAWVFDYPTSYYPQRDKALDRIVTTFSVDDWLQSHHNPVPVYLALGLQPPTKWQEKKQYTWQVDFIQHMLRSHQEFGLSLPAVFLTILTHFLDMVANQNQAAENYDPSEYRPLLFATHDDSSPLFLCDPLETVNSLIDALVTLWNNKSNRIQDYSSFRLVSAGILRGRLASNSNIEHSLVAYCGGWSKENRPCGNVPLVLGKQQHCESCGMLICDKCGFCSKQCPKNAARQAKFEPQSQSVIRQYVDSDYTDDILF